MNSIKILAPIFLTFLCITSQVLAKDLTHDGEVDDDAVSAKTTLPSVTETTPLNPGTTENPTDETKSETTTVEMKETTTQGSTETPTTTPPSNGTTTPSLTFPVIFVLALSYFCLH